MKCRDVSKVANFSPSTIACDATTKTTNFDKFLSQTMYVPRSGADSVGIAWWKDVEPCLGVATRLPTPSPTPLPTTVEVSLFGIALKFLFCFSNLTSHIRHEQPTILVETAESKAHDAYYINSVPTIIATVLNR